MTNVIELAKQAGIEFQKHVVMGSLINVTTRGSQPIEKIETLIKLVRNAAVQDERTALAELCDAMGSPHIAEYLREQAAAIESLKEPTP